MTMFLTRGDAILFRTDDLISELESRGFKVLAKSASRPALSWHRTEPFPKGLDFKAEATEKIRGQLTAADLEFRTRPHMTCSISDGELVETTVHSAYLRVFR
ncbi:MULTISPECIES: hypothetical protein [unclassified Bradyrhizobium]|uniref:hypothetical protein n=1 Tax=unclassified Bradyrhizobium TaxID=2631580 RepID=UPI0028E2300B|nr:MULTISPECIES: hypothetical protein [unclassified Bradyrhizobium]